MRFFDPGFIIGCLGILCGLVCLLALRKHRVTFKQANSELRDVLDNEKVERTEQIAQLGRHLAVLELSAQNIDQARAGGLTRAARSQAMQMLRSGTSPESAASTLGMGSREMRLIARVSRTLSLK